MRDGFWRLDTDWAGPGCPTSITSEVYSGRGGAGVLMIRIAALLFWASYRFTWPSWAPTRVARPRGEPPARAVASRISSLRDSQTKTGGLSILPAASRR